MVRRWLSGTLTLLGALLAAPGEVGAQGAAPAAGLPAPAPPGLDAAATPLVPSGYAPRRVIASSQVIPPAPGGPVPLPDDGLSAVPDRPAVNPSVRTAVYRPDVDAGRVEPVGLSTRAADGPERPAASQPAAGVRVELQVEGAAEVVAGRPFAYVIRVRNSGTAAAAGVRVTDRLPAGARLTSAEPGPEVAGDRLAWDLGDLPAGAERRLKVALAADGLTGELVVRPAVSFGLSPGLRAAPARPTLELRLSGPEAAPPGVVVPFRVQVTNNGPLAMPHVLAVVKLTPGLRHPQLAHGDAVEADVALGPGETKTLPLELVAAGTGPQAVAATARADGGPTAAARAVVSVDPATPAAAAATRPAARLRVEVNSLSEGLSVGGSAVYEVRVANADPAPRTGVRVVAELPEGLEADVADGPTASSVTPHGVVFETLAKLGAGESAVYHVRARALRAGVQRLRVEVNADRQSQPASAEVATWVAPGRGR